MLSFILSLPLSRVYDRDILFSFFISGCFCSIFMCLDSTSACFLFSSHFYSSFIFLVSPSFISLSVFSLSLSISLFPFFPPLLFLFLSPPHSFPSSLSPCLSLHFLFLSPPLFLSLSSTPYNTAACCLSLSLFSALKLSCSHFLRFSEDYRCSWLNVLENNSVFYAIWGLRWW